MPHPDLSGLAVVVVNYGSSSLLERNLAPLTRDHTELVTVVVDNFSSADERARLRALADREGWVRVEQENLGFGGGMNAGVARAGELGAEAFLLLNPDAAIGGEDAARLLAAVRAEPLTLTAPVISRPDGSPWFAGSDLYLADGRIRSRARRIPGAAVAPWLTGACLAVSRELWQAVGGFDPDYFLYWEDVDFSWRVRQVGGQLRVLEEARAVHAEGGTQGVSHEAGSGSAKSATYYYFNIRNRLLFAAKHLEPEQRRAWAGVTWRVAGEVLRQGGRRQFLRPFAALDAGRRGIADGLRALREPHAPWTDDPSGIGDEPLILVVCTANVCRSPLAAEQLRRELAKAGGWLGGVRVASAGTNARTGAAMCGVAQDALEDRGLGMHAHGSRLLTRELVDEAAVLLTLETAQRSTVAAVAPEARAKVFTLAEAAALGELLAGRVAAGAADPPVGLGAVVEALGGLRGLAAPAPRGRRAGHADPLTIADGHTLSPREHRRTVRDVRAAAQTLAAALRRVSLTPARGRRS